MSSNDNSGNTRGSSSGGGSSTRQKGDTPHSEKEMTGSNASGRRGGHHENTGTSNQKGGKRGGSSHHPFTVNITPSLQLDYFEIQKEKHKYTITKQTSQIWTSHVTLYNNRIFQPQATPFSGAVSRPKPPEIAAEAEPSSTFAPDTMPNNFRCDEPFVPGYAQTFSLTVHRESTPGPNEYVEVSLEKTVQTRYGTELVSAGSGLEGSRRDEWNGASSITFTDLKAYCYGDCRLVVDMLDRSTPKGWVYRIDTLYTSVFNIPNA
ncbi:hypothetical protein F4677DRAFT_443025 [Hypoxylon crocopeplum]|nr:hypothetical protein F4677DRAFT_443025 [Hypoxylon crocopeplum]